MHIGMASAMVSLAGVLLSIAVNPASAECDSSKASKPSSTRYVAKGGVVYDRKTDLTWMRCSQGQTWKDDLGCVGVPEKFTHSQANAGWSNGWRMPTVDELKTLVAKHCHDPAIDDELFPDTPSEWYHTSSKNGSNCWFVSFSDGRTHYHDYYDGCDDDGAVRLVRSGQ